MWDKSRWKSFPAMMKRESVHERESLVSSADPKSKTELIRIRSGGHRFMKENTPTEITVCSPVCSTGNRTLSDKNFLSTRYIVIFLLSNEHTETLKLDSIKISKWLSSRLRPFSSVSLSLSLSLSFSRCLFTAPDKIASNIGSRHQPEAINVLKNPLFTLHLPVVSV